MAHNGTIVGSPTFAAAKFGSGLTAVSDSNYISLPSGTFSFLASNSWTIDLWVKTSSVVNQIAISTGSASASVFFIVNTDGQLQVALTGATAGGAGPTVNDGSWHHVACTVSGASAKVFLDGVQIGPTETVTTTDPGGTVGDIGIFTLASGFAWGGAIDEVALWNAPKYTSNFTPPTQAYTGTEPNLFALYHLDGDATDSVGVPVVLPTIFADDSNIRYSGAWVNTGSGSGSLAKTPFTGTWVDAMITGTENLTIVYDVTGITTYPDITYVVDGGPPIRTSLAADLSAIVVSFPQSGQSTHHIRVWTAGVFGTGLATAPTAYWVAFAGFAADDGATTLPIALNPNMIECLGDSIPNTTRILSDCGGGSNDRPECMDGHNGFVEYAGAAIGLRSMHRRSVGLTGEGSNTPAIDLFPVVWIGEPYTPSPIPPIVTVIEYGTNDGAVSSSDWQALLITFLQTVRAAYPNSLIFCMGLPTNTHYVDMGTVVAGFGDSLVFYLNYHSLSIPTYDGTHPTAAGHAIIGAHLAADVQAQLISSGVTMGMNSGSSSRPFIVIQ